ncbi:MAG: hypothetical protein ABL911_01320 [Gallionella sp.]|nr:hypothetical protein [Gallionella sp.]
MQSRIIFGSAGSVGWIAILTIMAGITANVAAAPENNSSLTPFTTFTTPFTSPFTKGSYSAINAVEPIGAAQLYFRDFEHHEVLGSTVVTVLRSPQHGVLEPASVGYGTYSYLPELGYFGQDSATFLVEMDGKKIRVEFSFKVLHGVADDYTKEQYKKLCPKGGSWKISSILGASNNLTVTSVDYQPDLTSFASTLGIDTSSVTLNFADLIGGALGQTIGNAITLDTNASGNGWCIDTILGDNREYLSISNPFEWVVKAGSNDS